MVAVGVGNDGQSREEVSGAEDWPGFIPVAGIPKGEAVPEEVFGGPADTELHLDLPIAHGNGLAKTKWSIWSER